MTSRIAVIGWPALLMLFMVTGANAASTTNINRFLSKDLGRAEGEDCFAVGGNVPKKRKLVVEHASFSLVGTGINRAFLEARNSRGRVVSFAELPLSQSQFTTPAQGFVRTRTGRQTVTLFAASQPLTYLLKSGQRLFICVDHITFSTGTPPQFSLNVTGSQIKN